VRSFTLENCRDKLDKQVLHMDQGLCYCPEFRATHRMHDYPSRKLQLARAVYKGELEANEYIAGLLFQSILSRQGERWQNFGEDAEEFAEVMLLCREMMVRKGLAGEIVSEFRKVLAQNNGHIVPTERALDEKWAGHMPLVEDATAYLMLDDATYAHASGSARAIGEFLSARGIGIYPEIQASFAGFEYFAYGLIDEGIAHLGGMIERLEQRGMDTVITLSGQTHYLLQVFAPRLGLRHSLKIVNLLDLCSGLETEVPAYLYAGSFYLRYLGMASKINALLENRNETPIRNCAEFTPLYIADKRVNQLTIWQKPVAAEYLLLGMDPEIGQRIQDDAIADIKKGTQRRVIAFEPFAYSILCGVLGTEKVVYFADALRP
jgi:hypothetical protein